MPSRFWQRSQRSVIPTLLHHFGEQVSVIVAGVERSIAAMVERNPPVIYEEGGGVYLDDYVIRVKDNPSLGLTPQEITRGQTLVTMQDRANGEAGIVTKTIVAIELQANGILQLRLR